MVTSSERAPPPSKEEHPYARLAAEQHEAWQRLDARNLRARLDLQKPAHDIAEMRRLVDSAVGTKHQPDVFYEHEGRSVGRERRSGEKQRWPLHVTIVTNNWFLCLVVVTAVDCYGLQVVL